MICWIYLYILQVILELSFCTFIQIEIICDRFCVDLQVFEYVHEGIKVFGRFCCLLELELILLANIHGRVVAHFENIGARILAGLHSS